MFVFIQKARSGYENYLFSDDMEDNQDFMALDYNYNYNHGHDFVPNMHQHRIHHDPHQYLYDNGMGSDSASSLLTVLPAVLAGLCLLVIACCVCCIVGGAIGYGVANFSRKRKGSGAGYKQLSRNRNQSDHSDEVCFRLIEQRDYFIQRM